MKTPDEVYKSRQILVAAIEEQRELRRDLDAKGIPTAIVTDWIRYLASRLNDFDERNRGTLWPN